MGVLFFLIAIVVIIIVVWKVRKGNRRGKTREELINSSGYEVAVEIKGKLVQKGYSVGELKTDFHEDYAYGFFWVGSSDHGSGGSVYFSAYKDGVSWLEFAMQMENIEARHGYFYAIQNTNIALIVRSDEESNEIPPFIKFAAEVIANSGYAFKHPDWIFERDAKKWLNVMFQ